MEKINSIIFLIIVFSVITFCNSNTKNEIMYKNAIKYIATDQDFIQMLKDFNRYEEEYLFKDDELIYKVYPDVANDFFQSFKRVIDELKKKEQLVDFDLKNIKQEVMIDSTLVQYSKSDTANVQIFFTRAEGNLLSAEVFTRTQKYSPRFDGYRAIAMSNVGMLYLFVFDNNEIIEVRKKVIQYN